MRHPRPFALFLAVGAICSAAGMAATRMSAEAVEVEQPAPRISALHAESAGLSNAAPTVVTEASPTAAPTLAIPEPTAEATPPPATPMATPASAPENPPAPAPSVTAPVPVSTVQTLPSSVEQPVDIIVVSEKAVGLLDAMNAARIAEGLPALEWDTTLEDVAYARARNLVVNGYFDHYAPDGESAFSELAARGVSYGLAGENLARNNYPEPRTVAAAFDGLMASPGHRANILEERFSRVAVAAVRDGRMWLYVTVFMD
ncbi:MAG: hypothetical protein C3F10_07965 [Dehalococcoidia bacterium]|nr:MAG: hypothetical protein C3F10_07965 [Dehalococcoidia bacterium]